MWGRGQFAIFGQIAIFRSTLTSSRWPEKLASSRNNASWDLQFVGHVSAEPPASTDSMKTAFQNGSKNEISHRELPVSTRTFGQKFFMRFYDGN